MLSISICTELCFSVRFLQGVNIKLKYIWTVIRDCMCLWFHVFSRCFAVQSAIGSPDCSKKLYLLSVQTSNTCDSKYTFLSQPRGQWTYTNNARNMSLQLSSSSNLAGWLSFKSSKTSNLRCTRRRPI